MSEKKYPSDKNASWLNHNLKNMVSFGEKQPHHHLKESVTGRLKALVKKVEDLNCGMDLLKDRY